MARTRRPGWPPPPVDELLRVDDATEGIASWLGLDAQGRCLFYEPGTGACAIHGQLGEHALPVSCRQFPRVSLTDTRGTFVSLSHYCPTAARLLVDTRAPLAIVAAPPALVGNRGVYGLDARGALPPLVHPHLLHSLDSYDLWERGMVALLARQDSSAALALQRGATAAERIRTWSPAMGSLEAHVERELARCVEDMGEADPEPERPATALRLWDIARASVPCGVEAPSRPDETAWAWERHAASRWRTYDPVVRRYVAARAFASWLAYQGRGIRTNVLGLVVVLGVLQAETGRACAAAGRDLDDALLIDAIRASDLLLVHLADPADFASRLGVAEAAEVAAGHTCSPLEWLR